MAGKLYTTSEAAAAVGVSRQTLQGWIARGRIKPPRARLRNGVGVRLWSGRDLAELRKAKRRIKPGRPKKNPR